MIGLLPLVSGILKGCTARLATNDAEKSFPRFPAKPVPELPTQKGERSKVVCLVSMSVDLAQSVGDGVAWRLAGWVVMSLSWRWMELCVLQRRLRQLGGVGG